MKKPKYVRDYKDRNGVYRVEFRRKGHKGWPLRQPIRSPEFWEDYRAASNGEVPPGVLLRDGFHPASIIGAKRETTRWLVQKYKESAAFRELDLRTQRVRGNILDRFCEKYGAWPYAGLNRQAMLKLRDKKAETPEAANGLIKALRQVFKVAMEYGYHDFNPAADVPYLRSKNPGGFHAWTMAEVEQFEETHPIGTKARLAMALLLYTCQRRSDVVQFGRQHIVRNRLEFTQHKGRKQNPVRLSIPILVVLRRIIDASPCGDLTFLVTAFNKPFTSNGFGNRFRKWCDEAGLQNCSAHGLRKAAAARMAELGCSQHEIMAIGGWKTLKEVQRYTRSAQQKVLADSATEKLEAGKVSNLSTHAKGVRR
jgi:integrase